MTTPNNTCTNVLGKITEILKKGKHHDETKIGKTLCKICDHNYELKKDYELTWELKEIENE